MIRNSRTFPHKAGAILSIGMAILLATANAVLLVRADAQDLTVTASFADKGSIAAGEKLAFSFSRPLDADEGRIAVLIGPTDITALSEVDEKGLTYDPAILPLPEGETEAVAYLVTPQNEWREIARFPLRIGVNVNASGATVVFLTFGRLANKIPAEAAWCGELMPAAPDIGFRCNPATIFGQEAARLNRSTLSGNAGFTDIMYIPPSVARRAYQAAQDGQTPSFFYVRRFIDPAGGPDEFVPVTCRMAGGGARTPFALTDVRLSFAIDKPVLLVRSGEKMPALKAEIAYNGTGRLKGRWEVVLPGDEPPSERDLLTEATLPIEERGLQRRYTQLSRFNVFLPPTGKYTLAGPDPSQLPNRVEGQYLVLLRIEASDDKEADSNLAAVGAGAGVVHSGAVAGFPLPPLRYYVGSSGATADLARSKAGMIQLEPADDSVLEPGRPLDFTWTQMPQAQFYRVEFQDARQKIVLSALLPSGEGRYSAPSWLGDKAEGGGLRWRVVALDQTGAVIGETGWRTLRKGN